MKSAVVAVLMSLSAVPTQAQSPQSPQSQPVIAEQSHSRPVVMGSAEQWTMRSKAGRTYEISIARPSAAAPARGYPVMYVLDPSTAFATLVDTVRNQEQMFGPVVVVGVGYASDAEAENRTLDLTPPTDPANLPAGMPNGWGATGGNEAFSSFLVDELKPAIAKAVVVDPSRQALFGHSLGGLFVLHTLFTRSDAFDTYIAGSPSIWWGKKSILGEVAAFKAAQQRTKVRRRLLITVGELEAIASPEEIRLGAALKISDPMKLMREAKQVQNSAELAADLAALAPSGLEVHRVAFPDETHNSVIPAYLARGARFTLNSWFGTPVPRVNSPRLYVIDCGTLISNRPEEYNLSLDEVADTNMPVPCFLVIHPKGILLFDTGLPDRLVGRPVYENVVFGYAQVKFNTLKGQLADIGVAPEDITYLALSHSHFDHIGNANDYAGSIWLAQKAELDAMFGAHANAQAAADLAALAHARTEVITGDHDVFGDGTVILKYTPGHTPGHQSLYVKLAKTGGVLIAGDLYHYAEERTLHRMPPEEQNTATPASRAMIEQFLSAQNAQLWIGHSTAFFKNAIKSPGWYE